MKRKTLFCYLVTEVLPPFLFGLLTFTLILLLTRILRLVELVVTRGVPPTQIGKLIGLILPTFLEMTVPMAFLLAILLGLGRLANDQELLAMKASGVSPGQILWPMMCIALAISLVTLLLTLLGRPAANQALRKEIYAIAKTRVTTALKDGVFNDDFPKILIYVEELVPPGNTAQGVLIVDKREETRESVIFGKVARITTDEETSSLGFRLFDGYIHEREKSRPGFSQTRFNIYDLKLELDELISPVSRREAGPSEATLSRLLKAIRDKESLAGRAVAERMEFHQRISFGFVPLVFCLLGVALSLLPRGTRSHRSWGFMLCLFWLTAYYALLSLGKALGEKNLLPPAAALWFPNFIVGSMAFYLFRKAVRESPLYLPSLMDHAAAWGVRVFNRVRQKRVREAPF